MSGYKGDFTTANTLYVFFNTFDSNDPSASVIVSDFVVGDIAIYKNGSITQRSSTNGYTLLDTDGTNFDGLVGVHGFSIDLSDDTDSGFYAAGAEYNIVVGPVTVDAAVITFEAASFSIERAGGAIALLKGSNSLASIKTSTDRLTAVRADILTDWINGNRLDLLLDAVNTVTPDAAGTAPTAAEIATELYSTDTRSGILHQGTAAAVSASTITLAGNSFADDEINGTVVVVRSATLGAGQVRVIIDFDAGTEVATVSPNWTTTPTGTVVYMIIVAPPLSATQETRFAELDSANMPSDLDAVPTVGEIQTEMEENGSSLLDTIRDAIGTSGAGLTDLGGMSTSMKAEIESEVNDALDTAISELSQGVPVTTPTLRTGLMLLYMALRNKLDVATSATDTLEIHNDAGTRIAQKLLTDAAGDYSEAKMTSGA